MTMDSIAIGDEFQVNSTTSGDQEYPQIAALADGSFVVIWFARGIDGLADGVFGQRYSADGSELGDEFAVTDSIDGTYAQPSITSVSDGGFVVTWYASSSTVYGQRYNSDGAENGNEFLIVSGFNDDQLRTSVTDLSDGGFVAAWTTLGQDGSAHGIFAQQYNADGTKEGSVLQINTFTSSLQLHQQVDGFADGGFVTVWSSLGQDGSGWGVYGQLFNIDGTKNGSEFRVNTETFSDQWKPSVGTFSDGSFVVAWNTTHQDGSDFGVYGQRYNADGTKDGDEFQINTETDSYQTSSSVAALANGGFIVTWESFGQDGSGYGVYGQHFNADGTKDGDEFQISSHLEGDQWRPRIVAQSDGDFAVVWHSDGQDGSGFGVYGQFYGTLEELETPVSEGFLMPVGPRDAPFVGEEIGDGDQWFNAQDFWDTFWSTARTPDQYVRHLGEDWNRDDGADLGETIYAASAGKVVFSGEDPHLGDNDYGNVVIIEHRVINDDDSESLYYTLYAHLQDTNTVAVNDIISAEQAAAGFAIGSIGTSGFAPTPHLHLEIFSGEWETALNQPFVAYTDNPNLEMLEDGTEVSHLRDGDGNILVTWFDPTDFIQGEFGFEQDAPVVYAGGNGSESIAGGSGDDVISGDKGADEIGGGVGDDMLDGGRGMDTVFGGAGSDIVSGEQGQDSLYGGFGDDNLFGGKGADSLFGGNGEDHLDGGKGDDILDGGDDDDVLLGGSGADIYVFRSVEGESGNDIIIGFEDGKDTIQISGVIFDDLEITQIGSDTVIAYGDPIDSPDHPTGYESSITLTNISASTIDEADFWII